MRAVGLTGRWGFEICRRHVLLRFLHAPSPTTHPGTANSLDSIGTTGKARHGGNHSGAACRPAASTADPAPRAPQGQFSQFECVRILGAAEGA